ncbi:MAG: hypothetical protein L3J22_11615 [Xanthomonadales bacterium]|nr:hypothetical protein [Xanthomonadales bacterium]
MSLFHELKRRNVFKVAVAYTVAAWVLLQVVDLVLESIHAPAWVMQVFLLVAVLGFLVAVIIAWTYEITPEGLKRDSEVQREQSIARHTAKKLDKLTVVLLVVVLLVVIADRLIPESSDSPEPLVTEAIVSPAQLLVTEKEPAVSIVPPVAASIASLAVMPFANMSADLDNEYFSDGISEELLNLLVQVNGLRVPSRTSSFSFKGKNMDIKEIARQLSVAHILEGSVRKSGDQLRITAQLIDVSTDTHLWSKTYDRKLENIFAIQDEIAREIVKELKISLATSGLISRDEERPTEDMQAYQDYLRGRYLFIQRGIPSLKASIEALQSAVARDSQFVEAWASLSLTAATIRSWDPDNADTYIQISQAAGTRALELDENSAIAMTGLGQLKVDQLIWAAGLDYLQRAASLSKDANPSYFYGNALQSAGYITAAHKQFEKAEVLDPAYPQLQAFMGINARNRGDLMAAKVYFQRAIAGGSIHGQYGMYALALQAGDIESATAYLDSMGAVNSYYQDGATAVISTALANPDNADYRERAIKAVTGSLDLMFLNHIGTTGDIMQQLKVLLAKDGVSRTTLALNSDLWIPELTNLRQLPEFKQFLRDIGLVELWKTRGWPDLCQPLGEDDFECR